MRASNTDEWLHTIASLGEGSIGHLDVDDLLSELLGRISEFLEVDTAAVLLLDRGGRELVARAARGVEAEVRQGVRIPVGAGFAGRIAVERRPVRLDRVDATTVQNPILRRKGIRAMLGVPLQSGSRLLGVLHVGTFADRTFTDEDAALLEIVADRVTAAILGKQLDEERGAARILQRSLLPAVPWDLSDFEFATRYVPAQEGGVGGDWYDAFRLPSGDVWVMAGDVMGHGLASAVVMGRLRSALRSFALGTDDPTEVLEGANTNLGVFEPGETATVLCAVLQPPYDVIRLASAGHLPPVIATPGEATRLLELPIAVPLGVLDALGAKEERIDFPLGTALVAFTDGLVERRGESLDVGLERVRAVVTAENPERLCITLMEALIGDEIPRDDIAVIAMRRTTRR